MGIKNWFTKKSKVVLKEPKQTTRLFSLYGETIDLTRVKNKIAEIENTLNNLPELPDLSAYYTKTETDNKFYDKTEIDAIPFAKTNVNNNFVNQAIKGNTAFLEFRKQNNDRKGYIGIEENTSQDIHLRAETNSLFLRAQHDIYITPVRNAIYNKQPVEDNHITNKKYVDDKFASIPQPDLSNLAKLNDPNNFMGNINLFGNTAGVVGFSGKAQYTDGNYVPVEGNEFANKGYVDQRTKPTYGNITTFGSSHTFTKYDILSNLYKYTTTSRVVVTNGTYLVTTYNLSISANNRQVNYQNSIDQSNCLIIRVTDNYLNIPVNVVSKIDLKPGSTGTFTGLLNGNLYYFRINDGQAFLVEGENNELI